MNISYALREESIPSVACTNLQMTENYPNPMPPGVTVIFSATTDSCISPRFRFWLTDTVGVGLLMQDWGRSSRYSWITTNQTTPGVYTIQVDVRDASDANVERSVTVALALWAAPGATNTCAHLALIADPSPPQLPGTTVVFRAQVTSCPIPTYRFLLTDTRGMILLVQDWSDLASYSWPTNASTIPGDYLMRVDARNSGDAYADVALIVPYTLGTPRPGAKCTNLAVTPTPSSPQPHGTVVDFNASVQGCTSPMYRFWVVNPGAYQSLAQDWSPSPTFTWSMAPGGPAATFTIRVEARDMSDANVEQTVTTQYTLS